MSRPTQVPNWGHNNIIVDVVVVPRWCCYGILCSVAAVTAAAPAIRHSGSPRSSTFIRTCRTLICRGSLFTLGISRRRSSQRHVTDEDDGSGRVGGVQFRADSSLFRGRDDETPNTWTKLCCRPPRHIIEEPPTCGNIRKHTQDRH